MGQVQIDGAARLFNVLSEPTRLRILQALQDGPMSVSELMQALSLKQANASKQLAVLHHAGLLSRAKQGNTVRYAIRLPLVFRLCNMVCEHLQEEARRVHEALSSSRAY